VTVLAPFPKRPAGRVYPGYRRSVFVQEKGNSRVLRCFGTLSRSSGLASRLAENLSFGLTSTLALLFVWKPDVVDANSWPVLATGLVVAAARLRRTPVVVSIQDLYPESFLAQRRLSDTHVIVRLLRAIAERIARSSRFIVVISDRFAEIYRRTRGVGDRWLRVIPNWGSAIQSV
jgi:colanic acid biosynthesis glycosyl transferase WcaI